DERFAPQLVALLPKSTIGLSVWRGTPTPAVAPARSISLVGVAPAGTSPAPQSTPDADRIVSITYSSGTTGPPKGVMLCEKPYLMAGHVAGQLAAVRPRDVMLTWEPLYHIR